MQTTQNLAQIQTWFLLDVRIYHTNIVQMYCETVFPLWYGGHYVVLALVCLFKDASSVSVNKAF